jgi:predicted metal-binding membrane protein
VGQSSVPRLTILGAILAIWLVVTVAGGIFATLKTFVIIGLIAMAAMMLPSVSPVASLYARTIQGSRAIRIAELVAGYLAVWAAAGMPAYGWPGSPAG